VNKQNLLIDTTYVCVVFMETKSRNTNTNVFSKKNLKKLKKKGRRVPETIYLKSTLPKNKPNTYACSEGGKS
jgi:hypothetical protein